MSVTLHMEGLDELRAALRNLPQDLTAEAGHIVEGAANGAAADIRSGYPVHSGNLQQGVTATRQDGSVRFAAVSIVKSAAPHAAIFENGTKVRRTNRGANRGRMPQPSDAQRMIPKVVRARARMVNDLVELVRRTGAEVDA